MDTQELTKSTTALLAPALTYLLMNETAAVIMPEEIEQSTANATIAQVRALWELLRALAASQPDFERVARDLADAPDDMDAQAAFRLQLKKLLQHEPESAARLESLIKQTPTINTEGGAAVSGNVEAGGDFIGRDKVTNIRAGERGVAMGGNARGSVIITGDSGSINVTLPKPEQPLKD